ncbi:hypothetical protein VTL71DRAFT_16039 [Oculimacula yallundae]|uniref:Uncharacterized protein n=1 Tax=Oculimacula yallundae TaxID=86028 RepID=A0ABR4CEN6_9HELO
MSGPSQPLAPPPLSDEAKKKLSDDASRIGAIRYDVTAQTLPAARRGTLLTNYTKLAVKYGHPRGISKPREDHSLFKYTGKSGKTPVRPNSDLIAHEGVKKRARVTEQYQRMQNWGFTADELLRLGALPASDERPMVSDLNNTLYPAFMRSQWLTEMMMPKHTGAIPVLGDDVNGLWLAENPRIWAILVPCLQLASRIWVNQCEDSWLSTLFHGECKPTPEDLNETRLYCRSLTQVQNDLAATKNAADEMSQYVTLGIHSGHDLSGLPGKQTNHSGRTVSLDPRTNKIILCGVVSYLPPPSVLKTTTLLSNFGRTTQRFHVAEVIIHEFAHAAHHVKIRRNGGIVKEPFFGDEPLAELGYSFENHIFGGAKIKFGNGDDARGGPGLPSGGIGRYDHFTGFGVNYKSDKDPYFPKPVAPGMLDPFYVRDIWPINTEWAANLFKEDFWNTKVLQSASAALKMGPLKYGVRSHINKTNLAVAGLSQNILLDGTGAELGLFGTDYHVKTGAAGDDIEVQNLRAARNVETARIRNVLNILDYPQPGPPALPNNAVNLEYYAFNPFTPETNRKLVDAEPPSLPYTCPRYDIIRQWLVNNRDPFQLAIDTMYIHEESSFYRYIRDHSQYLTQSGIGGAITLTPHELRGFLFETQRRKELFVYEPFPAPGVLLKIAKGWPPRAQPYTFPSVTLSAKLSALAEDFEQTIEFDDFMEMYYTRIGEVRDVDIAEFQFMWNKLSTEDDEEDWDITLAEFEEVLRYVAANGKSSDVLTFGPKGVIRFTYDTSALTARPEKDDIKRLLARLRQKEAEFNN